jgi:hypothetical protein
LHGRPGTSPWASSWASTTSTSEPMCRARRIARVFVSKRICVSARAGNRRFRPLSSRHAHTKAPYKMYFSWENVKDA